MNEGLIKQRVGRVPMTVETKWETSPVGGGDRVGSLRLPCNPDAGLPGCVGSGPQLDDSESQPVRVMKELKNHVALPHDSTRVGLEKVRWHSERQPQ